jgi:hypothetical protein
VPSGTLGLMTRGMVPKTLSDVPNPFFESFSYPPDRTRHWCPSAPNRTPRHRLGSTPQPVGTSPRVCSVVCAFLKVVAAQDRACVSAFAVPRPRSAARGRCFRHDDCGREEAMTGIVNPIC